jgi:hypothetical protein
MNWCEYPKMVSLFMFSGDVCDAPASVKIGGHWYCEEHADHIEGIDEYGYSEGEDIE